MSQLDRLTRIRALLEGRAVVPRNTLLSELEISWATLKRDLVFLRDRMNMPVEFDRERGGYRLGVAANGPQYGLPGLWFNAREIVALLTMHRLLQDLDSGGLLGPHVEPLMERLRSMLGASQASADEVMRRVKVITAHNRPVAPRWFEVLGSALVQRQRVEIDYFTRSRNEHGRREISAQRLVHYRNAWYLEAWCHRSGALRVFAMDAIEGARLIERHARQVAPATLDRELGEGYGIYRGKATALAVLRFSADAARWVRAEVWHPQQSITELDDGGLELRIPFGAAQELEMDILRHGEQVEVLEPPALRDRIAGRLAAAARAYANRRG
ncbi:MAG: WYL domain-containing protein [Burkholderiales bacterium]|nr:WYL domain-containing protein [Burkholderiales bacterium]